MNDKSPHDYIELTANIVSAYVSNNTVPASEISALIGQVHAALMRVSNGGSVAAGTYDFFGVAAHEITEVMGRDLFVDS